MAVHSCQTENLLRRGELRSIFLAALLLRLALLAFYLNHDVLLLGLGGGDGKGYLAIANAWESGAGQHPYLLARPPLFPFLIYLLRQLCASYALPALLIVNAVLSAALAPLAVLLAARLGGSGQLQRVVGWMLVCDPTQVYFAVTPLSEPLFTLLTCAAVATVLNVCHKRSIGAGELFFLILLSAAALLTKPVAQGFCLVLAFGLWRCKLRRAAACLLGCGVLVILAWCAHNRAVFGNASFSSAGDWNLLFTHAVSVERRLNLRPSDLIRAELARRVFQAAGEAAPEIDAEELIWGLLTPSRSLQSATRDVALQVISAHPLLYLLNVAWSWLRQFLLLYPRDYLGWVFPLYALVFGLGIFGAVRMCGQGLLPRDQREEFGLVSAVIAYFSVAAALFHSSANARFMMPFQPLVFVLAAMGFKSLLISTKLGLLYARFFCKPKPGDRGSGEASTDLAA